jgi:hypothetical protein
MLKVGGNLVLETQVMYSDDLTDCSLHLADPVGCSSNRTDDNQSIYPNESDFLDREVRYIFSTILTVSSMLRNKLPNVSVQKFAWRSVR